VHGVVHLVPFLIGGAPGLVSTRTLTGDN
jgi:hypothetical protein